jgi:hypothetical protein
MTLIERKDARSANKILTEKNDDTVSKKPFQKPGVRSQELKTGNRELGTKIGVTQAAID